MYFDNSCLAKLFHFRWAAYVAGTVLVLMAELGVGFTDSMNILVSINPFYLLS
jgi:hypothetical protein